MEDVSGVCTAQLMLTDFRLDCGLSEETHEPPPLKSRWFLSGEVARAVSQFDA